MSTYEDAEQSYILELEAELILSRVTMQALRVKVAELGRRNSLLEERLGEFEIH